VDADHGALRHVLVRGEHFFHRAVERRWPATLMTSSMRPMIER